MLIVPFISQEGIGARKYRNDCAVACLGMVLAFNGKFTHATIDSLASETSLRYADTGVGAEELAMLATAKGLPMVVRRGIDVAVLRWELDRKRPCIVAVNEWKIPNRPGQPVGDGSHDLVLVGYSGSTFYAHDPAGRPNMPVLASDLAAAMAARGDCAVLVAAADAPPVTTPAGRIGVTTDRLRVRAAPSTAARIVTVLAKGARILVIEDAPGWLKIAEGRYVSADYVSF